MIYRRLDENGEPAYGQNKQNFLSGIDAVTQAIYTRLKLWYGEFWEDTTDGLPMLQQIINGRNQSTADLLIKDRIKGTDNVTDIASFNSSYNSQTRRYSFTATVNTVYGTTTVTG